MLYKCITHNKSHCVTIEDLEHHIAIKSNYMEKATCTYTTQI